MTAATTSNTRIGKGPLVGVCIWGALVLLGVSWLIRYKAVAGPAAVAAAQLPSAFAAPEGDTRPTLIMLAHPKCPCTPASLAELSRLLATHRGAVKVCVLFLARESDEAWAKTASWRRAEGIPGVEVRADFGGAIARQLGATTSGTVLLFGPDGRRLFCGGITPSRGHQGDNAGIWAVERALSTLQPVEQAFPVYGCDLGEDDRVPADREETR